MFRPRSRGVSGRRRPLSLGLATAAILLAWAASAQAAPFVYVTNSFGDTVSQYNVGVGGLLAPLSPPTVGAGNAPAGVAVSPNGRNVYVANNSFDGSVSQYDVSPSGRLSPKSPATAAAGTNPNGVAVRPDGKSVYVTFFDSETGRGNVAQYNVGVGGKLSPTSPPTVAAGSQPVDVAVSPDGRSVYVTNGGSNTVSQYNVGAGGKLSTKSPATVTAGFVPFAVAVSPNGQSVYVTNLFSLSISQYNVGAGGKLFPKSPPTVAAGEDPADNPTDVAVSPDGRSVYVTNVGDGAPRVFQYSVGAGGKLSPKTPPTVATAKDPAGVAVRPDGRSVYVTNGGSNTVSQYNVGAGGKLSTKSPATVPAGGAPSGVVVTPRTPGWEGPVTNQASGCTAKVQVPYLDANQQVTAYTKVSCPKATRLTVRSRLRADYPPFNDKTVARKGCLGGGGCAIDMPKGLRYFKLTCPKSTSRRHNQRYYSDIVFYPGTNSGAATRTRSRPRSLSPFCAR